MLPWLRGLDDRTVAAMRAIGALTAVVVWVMLRVLSNGWSSGGEVVDVIALELAGTPDGIRAVAAGWGQRGFRAAQLGLWVDFVFIAAYVLTLVAALEEQGRRRAPERRAVWRWAAAAAVLAGLLDVVENGALLLVLAGRIDGGLPAVAAVCARAKFALVALSGTAALVAIVAGRRRRG